jgi:hypothetical protein
LKQAELKALEALELQHNKSVMQIKLDQIADEKRVTEEQFREGQINLETRLTAERTLAKREADVRKAEALQNFESEFSELKRQRELLEKGDALKGFTPEQRALELDTKFTIPARKAWQAYEDAVEHINAQTKSKLSALDEQFIRDRNQAQAKAIQTELALVKEGLAARSRLVEKAFHQDQITAQEYYDSRLEQIQAEAEAERATALQTFATGPRGPAALQTLIDALSKAGQRAREQTEGLPDLTQLQLDQLGRTQGAATRTAEGAVTLAGEPGERRQALEEVISLTQDQAQVLRDLLNSGRLTADQLAKVTGELVQAEQRLRQFGQQLEQLLEEPARKAGEALTTLATSTQQIFHSKFAQNLADTVLKGASSYGKAADRYTKLHEDTGDSFQNFVNGLQAAVGAITDFVSTITGAKSGIAGALGGGLSGLSAGSMFGPIGSIVGGVAGTALGAITGSKNAKVIADINRLNTDFKNVMQEFALNTNNLQNTISQLQGLVAIARSEQASSKKGSAQYQQAIDQYNQQIMQLMTQQAQLLRQLHEQNAILSAPIGAQGMLGDLQHILEQYQKFAGAAQSAYDLAAANEFLTQSLDQYEQTLGQQLLQDNEQAIQDALQLNDLLYQRTNLERQYADQVRGILSQGILTRQMTRAQTTGEQIQLLNVEHQRQMEQLNEQIAASQFKVDAEGKVFALATTRIGLEAQLLDAQKAQAVIEIAKIAAISALYSQIAGHDWTAGPLGALLGAFQTVTTPGGVSDIKAVLAGLSGSFGSGSDLLDKLVASAYQDRASAGYAPFRASNL